MGVASENPQFARKLPSQLCLFSPTSPSEAGDGEVSRDPAVPAKPLREGPDDAAAVAAVRRGAETRGHGLARDGLHPHAIRFTAVLGDSLLSLLPHFLFLGIGNICDWETGAKR